MPEAKEASCLLGTNAKNAGKNCESVQKKEKPFSGRRVHRRLAKSELVWKKSIYFFYTVFCPLIRYVIMETIIVYTITTRIGNCQNFQASKIIVV